MWWLHPDLLCVSQSWVWTFHFISELCVAAPFVHECFPYITHNTLGIIYLRITLYTSIVGAFLQMFHKKLAVIFQRAIMNSCIRKLLNQKSQWSVLSNIIQFLPKAHVVLSSYRHFKIIWKVRSWDLNGNSWAANLCKEFNACFCSKPNSNLHLFLMTLWIEANSIPKWAIWFCPDPNNLTSFWASCSVALSARTNFSLIV